MMVVVARAHFWIRLQMFVRSPDTLTWAASATLPELRRLLAAHPKAITRGTLGPRDLMYTPAGGITYHKVFQDGDVLGTRVPVLTPLDGALLPRICSDIQKAGGQSTVIKAMVSFLEGEAIQKFMAPVPIKVEAPQVAKGAHAVPEEPVQQLLDTTAGNNSAATAGNGATPGEVPVTPTPTESQPDKGKDIQETAAGREEPEQQLLDTTAGNNAAAIAGNGATPGEVPVTPTPTESQPDKGKDVQETAAAREEPEQQLLDTTAGNNAAAIAGNGATPGEVPVTPTPTESQPDKGKDVQETTAAREEPEQQLLDTTAGNNAAAIAGNGATPGEVPVTPTESQPDKGKDGKGADAPAAATPTDVMGHNAGAPTDGSGISAVASATDQNATAPTDHLAVSAELAKGAPPETGDIEVAKGAVQFIKNQYQQQRHPRI